MKKFEGYKVVVRDTFIMLFVFSGLILLYKRFNPFIYPGLETKVAYVMLLWGLLLVVVHAPYADIMSRLQEIKSKEKAAIEERFKPTGLEDLMQPGYSRKAIHYLFQFLLTAFLVTLLLNEFRVEFIRHAPLDYFFVAVVFFGAVNALLMREEGDRVIVEKTTLAMKDYALSVLAGVIGACLVYYKIASRLELALVIALLSGLLIALISVLLLEESPALSEDPATA